MEAKQAADTEPTYPNPKMLTDKPKRILLAIEYLGLLRGTMNYTNPQLSGSKLLSIGALDGLNHRQHHPYFQYVTEYPPKPPESRPAVGQRVDNYFHWVGILLGQIAHSINRSAAGRVPVRVRNWRGTNGNR
jgi:hypothetical protein